MTQRRRASYFFAAFLSVALHALLLILAGNHLLRLASKADDQKPEETITFLEVMPAPLAQTRPAPSQPTLVPAPVAIQAPPVAAVPPPSADRQPAFMEAPSAPTAQEWALAANYTLKNSKRYRHTWGQQVRSMMGTAIEGPDQGLVRFRVEIAPDGTLARLETLWTTSVAAEKLARKAIANMPRLPPTPNGQPLIFEKTISFQPFAADDEPIYKNDCLPDPPAFRNPFAWDGKSPQVRAAPPAAEKPDPQALEECLRQLPQDSVEAESAHDQRQLEQWRSNKLGR
jgi:hypothetical protein